MRASIQVQTPLLNNIGNHLANLIKAHEFNEVRVASAYVTVSGVRKLLAAFGSSQPERTYWLVGLDDVVTQPGAIDLLRGLEGAEVRVAALEESNARFHPKYFSFNKSGEENSAVAMLGSANLTASALVRNAEAVAFVEADNTNQFADIMEAWQQLWVLGEEPDDETLNRYKEKYKKRQKKKPAARIAIPKNKKKSEVLSSDSAEIDPSMASICWIECGKVTAMGRELEFKAEQGMFFGLQSTGGDPTDLRFRASNGNIVTMKMKYQQNHMWRLQMNNDVPEVSSGLRKKLANGRLGRSPFVAVFKRAETDDLYDLSFVRLKSAEFRKLYKETQKSGTVGHTTARSYGWR